MHKKRTFFPDLTTEAKHLDKLLDGALIDTFPASDPVAINIERFDGKRVMQMAKHTNSATTQ